MKYASLAIIALLILAACAPTEPSKAKQIAEEIKEQTETPAVETPQTEQPIEQPTEETAVEQPEVKTPAKDLVEAMEETTSEPQKRTKMYRFLDTFAKDVKSYQFKYKKDSYFTKGTRYKIILYLPSIVKGVTFGDATKSYFYYDTVYVDRAGKTAVAYCEGHNEQVNKQCAEFELYDLGYPVNYDDYEITLPEDWLFSYLNKEPSFIDDNKYYIQGRASVFLKFNEEPVIEMSMDPGTGLPLRVDQKKGNQILGRYDYENLASNKVRDVDMEHRTKSEIPTTDAFYTQNW